MKIFIYKSLTIALFILILYYLTIGETVHRINSVLQNIQSIEKIKYKLKKEMNKSLQKDKIFYDEDRVLLKAFLEKVFQELNFNIK